MSELDAIIKQLNKKEDIPVISKGIPKRNWSNIPFSSPNLNWMTYRRNTKRNSNRICRRRKWRKDNNRIRFSSKCTKTV